MAHYRESFKTTYGPPLTGGPFLFIWCKSMQKKTSFEMKPLKYGIWLIVNREWQPATYGGIK